jgi:hypothetical protein
MSRPSDHTPRASRRCAMPTRDGRACHAAPMVDSRYCFLHDPEHIDEAAKARKLGGLRRRRERTLAIAYDLDQGLGTAAGIGRLLEMVMLDTVGLDNSASRARVLIATATAAIRLLETTSLELRLDALDSAYRPLSPKERKA